MFSFRQQSVDENININVEFFSKHLVLTKKVNTKCLEKLNTSVDESEVNTEC